MELRNILPGAAVVVAVLALTASVLALGAFSPAPPAVPQEPQEPAASQSAAGPQAPWQHFELSPPLRAALAAQPALWGPRLQPAALEGQVVVVTFFASWCMPCRAELQALRQLHAELHGAGLRVIAVNRFEDYDGLSDARRRSHFLERMALPFPVVEGSEGLAQSFGGVDHIPTLLLFDRTSRRVPVEPLRTAAGGNSSAGGGNSAAADRAGLRRAIAPLL